MGRGVVSVARYEKGSSKKKRPPANIAVPFPTPGPDSSPVEISPGGTKRKWYQTPILGRRNTSLSGIVYPPNFVAKTSPMSVDDQPRLDPWEEGEQAELGEPGPGPSTLAARQVPIPEIHSPRPGRPSPRLDDTYLGAHTPSTASSPLHLPNLASHSRRTSITGVSMEYQKDCCQEEEDASALAQLEALGLGSVPEPEDRADQEHLEDLAPEPEIPRLASSKKLTIRPLPSVPHGRLPSTLNSPPVSSIGSHDSFADASPRQSGVPPPPYVAPQSPQSAAYSPTQVVQEDALTAIRRKNEKQVVQRWIIENH